MNAVISDFCKRQQQNRPFSHIVMDLHQEALAELETTLLDNPWGLPVMPELKTRTINRNEHRNVDNCYSLSRRRLWIGLNSAPPDNKPKLTREASTSMEDLTSNTNPLMLPGRVLRPKSMCIPSTFATSPNSFRKSELQPINKPYIQHSNIVCQQPSDEPDANRFRMLARSNNLQQVSSVGKRARMRRNPVQRAASRLYRAGDATINVALSEPQRFCVGPEFVVRAKLPSKQLLMPDSKGSVRKVVTVIMLDGQKLDIICNPNTTTAGQVFELIIQKEHIEENFMLGLSALIAGDFVFLPSDARICKAMTQPSSQGAVAITLFVRIRFFLPSLRAIRSLQARHLLYLQLRRSVLEHQLPCSYTLLVDFGGLALQAEFGDFNEKEHGTREYFLLEHYIPEIYTCKLDDNRHLQQELTKAHIARKGMDSERAEEDFIVLAQTLPHYGGHFYTASWVPKDGNQKHVWLYISARGINLYERHTGQTLSPVVVEMFEWRTIQTLCYSKHYLCILPHLSKLHGLKLKKYKLKMDNKKSYFTFRLASLHHQFFLRLRTQYTSLQSLSDQFGIPLKDIKNETNSLYKLEALTNNPDIGSATENAHTEFNIEFCTSNDSSVRNKCRRSKSVSDFSTVTADCKIEEFQNKENENPKVSLVAGDKRRGVKMGVRAFSNGGQRITRSMEAVNALNPDDLEQLSLQSISLHCSSTSMSRSPTMDVQESLQNAYVLDSTIKSVTNQFLPDFHETLSESLVQKLNNFSFADERNLQSVVLQRDLRGSLGLQITEGSDGKVYIQSVIPGGPADICGEVHTGDQIIAVNRTNLLNLKYEDALEVLKSSGPCVEFLLSQVSKSSLKGSQLKRMSYPNTNRLYNSCAIPKSESPVEKHVTENCHDVTNRRKHRNESDVPYHKHIRYDFENNCNLNRNVSKSCSQLSDNRLNRAVIVDMIPKPERIIENLIFKTDDNLFRFEDQQLCSVMPIAMPRSLGLSRKWRGPVKYPVTPIKRIVDNDSSNYNTGSDEEQVFI